jgi:hypothetical protein
VIVIVMGRRLHAGYPDPMWCNVVPNTAVIWLQGNGGEENGVCDPHFPEYFVQATQLVTLGDDSRSTPH